MRLIGAIAVGLGLLCVASTAAQRSPARLLTDAEKAIRAEKSAVLLAALKRESPIEPERLAESIRVALGDTDSAIRELALATVSARTVAPTFTTSSAEMKREWERERPALQRLRPMVVQALDDENENVRRGAAGALQSLDYDGTQVYGRMLSAETTRLWLVAMVESPRQRSVQPSWACLGAAQSKTPQRTPRCAPQPATRRRWSGRWH